MASGTIKGWITKSALLMVGVLSIIGWQVGIGLLPQPFGPRLKSPDIRHRFSTGSDGNSICCKREKKPPPINSYVSCAPPMYCTNRRQVSLSEGEDPKMVIEREQSERRSKLKKECELAEMDSNTISEYTMKHMLVVEDYKLVYCFIPKVGCSNWKRILMVLDNQTDSVQGLSSNEVHINGKFKYMSSYGQRDRTRILKDYNKFFFVRHPFVRILSVFKNKLENLNNYRKNRHFHQFGREIIRRWRPSASHFELLTGENATWSEFIQYLTHKQRRSKFEMANVYFSDHWAEMYKICSPCAVKYDFIGLLENVAEESKYFLDKLGVGRKVQYLSSDTSRPTNSSERSLYEKYYSHLSHEELVRLWEIYQYDFQFFGYPKPWFVQDL